MNISLKITSLLVFVLLTLSCQEEIKDNSPVENFENLVKNRIISVDQGITMYKEHTAKRTTPLEPILREMYNDSTFVDTKFVHFSLQDMKDYIAFLEEIEEQNPNKNVSGVRVYFSAYPNSSSINNKTIKNPGQQSIFMVPTTYIGETEKNYKNLNNLPFYIEATSDNPYKGNFKIIEDLMLDYNKKDRLKSANNSPNPQKASLGLSILNLQNVGEAVITSTLFNEGEMSPPPVKSKID